MTTTTTDYAERVASMKRAELIREAGERFPDANLGDGNWLQFKNAELREALTNGQPPTPKASANGTPSIEDAIRAIAAQAVSSELDEERVRAIAREVAEDFKPRPNVTEVHLPDREPVTIEGTQHARFTDLLRIAGARLNALLVGPAGTGKTTLAHEVAKALCLSFRSVSLAPVPMSAKVFGFIDAGGSYVRTGFRECYEHGGVFLFDELDNAHPGVLAEVNKALANGGADFPDGYIERHPDFVCIAAANTYGNGPDKQYVGRSQLDAATLDRFVTVEVAVDEALEEALTLAQGADEDAARSWLARVREVRARAAERGVRFLASPRASIEGARLLAAGFDRSEVEAMRLWKGASADVRSKLDS